MVAELICSELVKKGRTALECLRSTRKVLDRVGFGIVFIGRVKHFFVTINLAWAKFIYYALAELLVGGVMAVGTIRIHAEIFADTNQTIGSGRTAGPWLAHMPRDGIVSCKATLPTTWTARHEVRFGVCLSNCQI